MKFSCDKTGLYLVPADADDFEILHELSKEFAIVRKDDRFLFKAQDDEEFDVFLKTMEEIKESILEYRELEIDTDWDYLYDDLGTSGTVGYRQRKFRESREK